MYYVVGEAQVVVLLVGVSDKNGQQAVIDALSDAQVGDLGCRVVVVVPAEGLDLLQDVDAAEVLGQLLDEELVA